MPKKSLGLRISGTPSCNTLTFAVVPPTSNATGRLLPVTREGFFPHVYGPINLDAVIRTVDLVPNEQGNFILPRPA